MYLFDTSIFSYLFRNDRVIGEYADELERDTRLFLSVQTVGELRVGASSRRWGSKRQEQLHNFIATFTVLPITDATTSHYCEIIVSAKRSGQALTVADAWIMATARQFGLTLVSHDRDMKIGEKMGIVVICRA